MAVPVNVQHTGTISGSPPAGSLAGTQSLQEIMNTNFFATFASAKSARPSIVGATFAGTPFVFQFETIVKVRMLALRVLSGSLKLRVTSPAGAQQIIPVSGFIMLYNPAAGAEFTVIDAEGTADIEYVLGGDAS